MSETTQSLARKIGGARELQSVARTMKALAAATRGQYEDAVHALGDYYRAVELGLVACFRHRGVLPALARAEKRPGTAAVAIVLGSDQGLVGQFNDQLAEFVAADLNSCPEPGTVWAVGERLEALARDFGLGPERVYPLPASVSGIAPLVTRILLDLEAEQERRGGAQVSIFHNRSQAGVGFEPIRHCLLPLDEKWRKGLEGVTWPTKALPEVMEEGGATLVGFVREYLFVSLFKALAESLASENASRFAAMQRAEKNIGELLEELQRTFHRLRQNAIDEELFEVVAGFEALFERA